MRRKNITLSSKARWSPNGITVAGGYGEGDQLNQLAFPIGLYVYDDQTVYVADRNNHRIVAWSPNAKQGQVVAGANGEGDGLHQLDCPIDVIIDRSLTDTVLISDYNNRRVVRWPRHSGTRGEVVLSNIGCLCLTMDDHGFLYISDLEKHEVRRFRLNDDSQGTLVAGGNGQGNDFNQLNYPSSLFVDRDHSLYVTDNNNNRVMKWVEGVRYGLVVAGGNGAGSDLYQLNWPRGLFVDEIGTVYVSDCSNQRVVCWPRGATEGIVLVGGNGAGNRSNQLYGPEGLSIDNCGHLYVVDRKNTRVQKFELLSS